MKIANIDEVETDLCELIESVLAGEEVIITKAGKPIAKLIPYQEEKKARTPGLWEGQISMYDDSDDDLPDEILTGFMDSAE
jgi:prevent-host-death family protein